jgi:hypothetical protein
VSKPHHKQVAPKPAAPRLSDVIRVLSQSTASVSVDEASRRTKLRVGRYVVTGLTKAIDEICAYDPVITAASKKSGLKAGATTMSLAKSRGKWTGTLVDGQLTRYINQRILPDNVHPWTRLVIKACSDWEWTPVMAQVPVGCGRLRVGTLVDALFRDKTGRLVLVEFKTGCEEWTAMRGGRDRVLNRPTADVKTVPAPTNKLSQQQQQKQKLAHIVKSGHPLPCAHFRMNPQTIHSYCQVQAAGTLLLFSRSFPGLPLPRAFIVRVRSSGVDRVPVEIWARDGVKSWLEERSQSRAF